MHLVPTELCTVAYKSTTPVSDFRLLAHLQPLDELLRLREMGSTRGEFGVKEGIYVGIRWLSPLPNAYYLGVLTSGQLWLS